MTVLYVSFVMQSAYETTPNLKVAEISKGFVHVRCESSSLFRKVLSVPPPAAATMVQPFDGTPHSDSHCGNFACRSVRPVRFALVGQRLASPPSHALWPPSRQRTRSFDRARHGRVDVSTTLKLAELPARAVKHDNVVAVIARGT